MSKPASRTKETTMLCQYASESKRSRPLDVVVLSGVGRALEEQHWNTPLGRWDG